MRLKEIVLEQKEESLYFTDVLKGVTFRHGKYHSVDCVAIIYIDRLRITFYCRKDRQREHEQR